MTAPSNQEHMSTVVGLDHAPAAIRALDAMGDADYVDVITMATDGTVDASPEQWARTLLEETSTGRAAPRLWHLLGLRLGPRPSPDHVQGWRIAGQGEDWIRLETGSWCMTAHALVHLGERDVSLALFIRFDRPIAAVIWPPVGVTHRRAVPGMLRQAQQVLRAQY